MVIFHVSIFLRPLAAQLLEHQTRGLFNLPIETVKKSFSAQTATRTRTNRRPSKSGPGVSGLRRLWLQLFGNDCICNVKPICSFCFYYVCHELRANQTEAVEDPL